MGMLDRIKRHQFAGFKEFVQNMEITGVQKRQQIFMAGVLEDPLFMGHVMKNLKTFEDFLNLPSDEIDLVLTHQEQVLAIFAKCMFGLPEEKLFGMESIIPRFFSRFKDELSYLTEVSPGEREGAKYYILKLTRKLQTDERINGFQWQLPDQDIFYPKTYKDGKTQIFFESGALAAEGEYFKGKRIGYWRHNYDSGKILAEGDYDSSGLKSGVWVFYYGAGTLKSQGKYKDDLKHGVWREWDRNGALTETEFSEGVKV